MWREGQNSEEEKRGLWPSGWRLFLSSFWVGITFKRSDIQKGLGREDRYPCIYRVRETEERRQEYKGQNFTIKT